MTDLKSLNNRQLSIPIYLNQRIVFDLLAVVEEGFTQLRSIRSSESDANSFKGSISSEIGAPNVFTFLGITLGASGGKEKSSSNQREISEERVYTPASLFSRLRDILLESELLHTIDSSFNVETLFPGTFVEFDAILHRNPLIEAIETITKVMDAERAFRDSDTSADMQKNSKASGNKQGNQHDKNRGLINQLVSILEIAKSTNTVDLVGELGSCNLQAVIPLDTEFITDKALAIVADGQFSVLGKVVRNVPASEDESINLLRGTALSTLPAELFTKLRADLSKNQVGKATLPEINVHIYGPAIQVIPIAIYI